VFIYDQTGKDQRKKNMLIEAYERDLPLLPHLVLTTHGDGNCLMRSLMFTDLVGEFDAMSFAELPRTSLTGVAVKEAYGAESDAIEAYRRMYISQQTCMNIVLLRALWTEGLRNGLCCLCE
jgi:hypothetical protein